MDNTQKRISKKISEIQPVANEFPGVIIIHNIQEKFNKVEYMSPRGAAILGTTLEEVKALGAEYYTKFFNEEDAKDYVPKMIEMIQRNNPEEIYPFFQQVRASESTPWAWYISSTRILLNDENNQPLLSITFAVPIDPLHTLTNKVSRLLEENNFLRLNFSKFAKLSPHEKNIAGFFAKGLSAAEISERLYISIETVKTHRKNIYTKLEIQSSHELSEYARAFDLV